MTFTRTHIKNGGKYVITEIEKVALTFHKHEISN